MVAGLIDVPVAEWNRWVCDCVENEFARARTGLCMEDIASLTGQDRRALDVVNALWHLVAASDDQGREVALAAIKALLRYAMQPTALPVARALIAFAMDWSDIERLWPLVLA